MSMLPQIGQFFTNQVNVPTNIDNVNKGKYPNLAPLSKDTISFTGAQPTQYKDTMQYFAAEILKSDPTVSATSPKQIGANMEKLLQGEYINPNNYAKADLDKIKWKSYITDSERQGGVELVNKARKERIEEWAKFLNEENQDFETVINNLSESGHPISNDTKNAIKIVIWNAINSELSENNRHVPIPLNQEALTSTLKDFLSVPQGEIKRKCNKEDCCNSFLNAYSNTMINNVLERRGLDTSANSVWVKISSKSHDKYNNPQNINDVEILSHKNWCTRSRADKAEAALLDGDFHVYLEKNPKTKNWEPKLGIASAKGKLCQIQGANNDYTIPPELLDTLKAYIEEHGYTCSYNINRDFAEAGMQILMTEKLQEFSEEIGETFQEAIQNKNNAAILEYIENKPTELEDGTYEIGTYKGGYSFKNRQAIPYSIFGIDEDALLSNVSKIDGDFYLSKSNITEFPKNLKEVTKVLYCTREQYEMYKEDIDRVTANSTKKPHQLKICS